MTLKTARNLALVGLLLALSACAQNRYCLKSQPYDAAKSIPPLHGTSGLDLPRSDGALVVPSPPSKAVPFGRHVKTAKGGSRIACLDQPPPFKPYSVSAAQAGGAGTPASARE